MSRLKEYRENAGFSQKKAAEELNIERTILSKIENGKRRLDPYLLFQMAKLYKISPEELLDIEKKEPNFQFLFRDADKLNKNSREVLEKISEIMDNIFFLEDLLNDKSKD
ncbi:MAG: helix-turn-helix transcriptional regulator [Kosmotoga sp.]|nr:MAG: helix-turn-helix transcriptional regulator [Kosmotoga sp.]